MIELSKSQQEVVDFLTGLPEAQAVEIHVRQYRRPGGGEHMSTRVTIQGGGEKRRPNCPHCSASRSSHVTVYFTWRGGEFEYAVVDRGNRVDSIKRVRERVLRRLAV